MSECGRICKKRKLKVNVGKNLGRMYARQNGEPLEEVDYFKYLVTQVAAGGGCERGMVHRMNKGYKA